MAVYFDMAICTGASEATATEVAAHMAKLDCLIDHWKRRFGQDQFGAWWTLVVPQKMGWGVPHDDEGQNYSEAEKFPVLELIYSHLRIIRNYELAVMGCEAADRIKDLDDRVIGLAGTKVNADFIDGPNATGTVMSEAVWAEANKPAGFISFSPGYLWHPGLDRLAKELT